MRDSTQWSQLVMLAVLLVVYVVCVANVRYPPLSGAGMTELLRNIIPFLNLALAGFVLASIAARFVFPRVSLERRALWLLLCYGTFYPQFDTENAAQIPTSFGGLLFMMTSIVLIGAVAYLAGRQLRDSWWPSTSGGRARRWTCFCLLRWPRPHVSRRLSCRSSWRAEDSTPSSGYDVVGDLPILQFTVIDH